jgi:hypothetical protein
MRFFYDTEFIENGKTVDLISIGMVCDDGREFYLQNSECDFGEASGWVEDNVLIHLIDFDLTKYLPIEGSAAWAKHDEIGVLLHEFVEAGVHDGKIEFWGYYADYDHVALCQLFGTMMDLPKNFPMYTRDLKQRADRLGVNLSVKMPPLPDEEHYALADARWNKRVYDFLESKEFLSAKA